MEKLQTEARTGLRQHEDLVTPRAWQQLETVTQGRTQ